MGRVEKHVQIWGWNIPKNRWFWRGTVEMGEARSRALTPILSAIVILLPSVEMGEARCRSLTLCCLS